MAKKARIGVIGTGGIATYQARYLQKIAGVQILAACDPDSEALKTFADEFNVPNVFKSYKQLVTLHDLDAVIVCTPNILHKAPTIAALNSGKHVLVEKPMAMNARDAQAMVDAATNAKRKLVIGFQYRFTPVAQLVSKAVKAGSFGKILYIRAQALRRRGIPNWGVFGRKELQGGGPMIDIGVHILEAAHYIAGRPKPISANGSTYRYIGDKPSDVASIWPHWDHKTYNVEDLAIGHVRFENGTTLTIETSFAAHIEKDVLGLQIMGEKAGCTIDLANFIGMEGSGNNSEPLQVYTDHMDSMFTMTPNYIGNEDFFEYKMSHFVECVRDNKNSDAPGEDGLTIQKMIDAIYRSADIGKEVRIR